MFASFDPQPLATGSIGQAHLATLLDGTEVVVKVRRPGVVEQVEEDLGILQGLAEAAARRWELARHYDLVTLVQEFAETLRAELDYTSEGQNADYFANFFQGESGVHIPRVYWEMTTARVITLERINGTKVSDLAALDSAGIDRKELARRAGTILLRMVFETGTFHADPHPGNIFVESDGTIGLIDFGMVGVLDDATKEELAELFLAVSREDVEELVDALVHIGIIRRVESLELLKRDLQQLFDRYYHRSLGDMRVGQLLNDILSVTRRHHLQLPSNLFLLIKTLIMSEGVGAQLDPEYNLSVLIKPYATKLLLGRYHPAYWGKRLGRVSGDLLWLGMELPTQLRRLVREVERGNLVLPMQPVGLENALQRLEGMVNRLVLGMVLAAFLIGLALLMTVYHPLGSQRWMGMFFGFGFAVVLALGGYLLLSMINRSRRSR